MTRGTRSWRAVVLGVPGIWLLLLGLAPLLIALAISFGTPTEGAPPYDAPLTWTAGGLRVAPALGSYLQLLEDDLYLVAFLNSLRIAATATAICLLIGYPMALAIARAPEGRRPALLLLVMLPFWTSFLVRVYAWITILRPTGIINSALIAAGLIAEPLPLYANEFAVHLGIVYSYLPFMVLPLYVAIERVDPALLAAAADLGARPATVLRRILLPLTLPGMIAGAALVFIPAAGEFVIPDLLGASDNIMIGRVLWNEFFSNRDWPAASAIAVALLVVLVAPVVIAQRAAQRPAQAGERET
jgi:putrescine transport system permease protein